MNNKYLKKCIAIILSGAMSAGAVPAVLAEDVTAVTVRATAVMGDTFLVNEQNLVVESDTAEIYGYDDDVTDGVSALDVLVKMHEVEYGEEFTPDTARDYLVYESAWLKNVFGDKSGNIGYTVNREMAWDLSDIMSDGDVFELFSYQDTYFYTDMYAHIDDFTAVRGEETTVHAEGYMYMYEDSDDAEPMEDLQLAYVNGDGSMTLIDEDAATDEDGNITVVFDEVGTYYLTLTGTDAYDSPVIPSITTVTVIVPPAEAYEAVTEDYKSRSLAYGNEWIALGLARSGVKVDDAYYSSLINAVKSGTLDGPGAAANYARTILALTAMGKKVDDTMLDVFSSYSTMKDQYVTSVAYALIALNSNGYEIPENPDDQNTIEKMIKLLIDALDDEMNYIYGVDNTVIIIQALAPYYGTDADVTAAVDRALEIVENTAETNVNAYTDYCSMYAQIVIAYTLLELDPTQWLYKMMQYYSEDDGAFIYAASGKANEMSTYQAHNALTAYFRYIEGRNNIYDMSDDAFYKITASEDGTYTIYSPFENVTADFIGADYKSGILDAADIESVSLKRGDDNVFKSVREKIMLWSDTMEPLCGAYTVK